MKFPIRVKTHNGSRYHGQIDTIDRTFTRKIDGRYIRWSDRSFTINIDAIQKIKDCNIEKIVFIYQMANQIKTYEIQVFKMIRKKPKVNEYGEKNIRIPIDDCKCAKTEKEKVINLDQVIPRQTITQAELF